MLYRQAIPGVVGIRGVASAEATDARNKVDNALSCGALNARPARTARALTTLGNEFGFGSPRRLRNLRLIMSPKYCTSMSILVLVFSLHVVGFAATPPSFERHVVVIVWDGMRPDFVTKENTPALWKLSREGVTFRNHHAVYPARRW
jgi:hypothetical protein